jgi:hypothetical protein
MKYKVGDKVRFVKDYKVGTGEVIPVNSVWEVKSVLDAHYRFECADKQFGLMIESKIAEDYCEIKNTAPSITKRINDKHNILNGLLNSDGSVDGEKLMEKLSNQSNDMAKGSHYEKSAMQPLEVSQVLLTKEQFEGALLFNIIKYRMRKKGQDEADAYKARQYAYWLEMAREGRIINPSKDKVPFDYKFSII